MQKSGMTMTALMMAVFGMVLAGPQLSNPVVTVLIALMFLWAGVEFFVGFFRTVEGISPSHPWVKIARMFWPLFALYCWLDLRYGWTTVDLPSWVSILLTALCFAGLALRLLAVIHLGKSFTYDVKRPEGNALVTTGPYRFVRHPGYLGIVILASLPGLILGSIPGFFGLTLTTVIHTVLRLRAEDKILEKEFGQTFREYKRKTYSLVPFIY